MAARDGTMITITLRRRLPPRAMVPAGGYAVAAARRAIFLPASMSFRFAALIEAHEPRPTFKGLYTGASFVWRLFSA